MKLPWLAILIAIVSIAPTALGQTFGGTFRGEVRDTTNAVVSHAKIQILSSDNGMEIFSESNDEGLYVTPTLIPGSYVLSATKSGFEVERFGPVLLQVNQTVRVDFGLKVGSVSDSVQVDAGGTQLLGTNSAEVSQVIPRQEVAEIPLNERAWQGLLALSAGVNLGAPGESGSPNPVNVNGQRTKANLFLVDGISTTSSAEGRGNNFNIPLDAVREFSVQAGAYSAEYGNVGGGVITLQTKSGTNEWHGSGFEFFRNDAMDASNFFSNATGQPKTPLSFNQFGGSAGGPLRRNKTFVFADYQGTIERVGVPMITSLPTAAQRIGDFSGLSVPIYDPFGSSLARVPYSGNQIPVTDMDSAARNLTAALPAPNQLDSHGQALPFNNYAVTPISPANFESFDVRVDHQFSDASMLFARDSFQNTTATTPSIFGPQLGGSLSGAGGAASRTQVAGIGHTYQFSPTMINELRVGLNRETSALTQEGYGQNLSQQYGIPGANVSPQTSGLSTIDIAGLFNLGGSILTPLHLASTDWNFSDKIQWIKGRHALRFGVDDQYEMGSTGYLVYGRGFYTFLNLSTSSLVGTAGGNAFASFLVGAPYQILRDTFPPGMVGLISTRIGAFVQDDITVSSRFTVNLGARYDIMPSPREEHNRLSNFDPATGTMLIAGLNTSQRLRATDYKDVAPRVGLAYAPGSDSKTVIRAGYGIGFVDPLGGESVLNSNEFNIPFYYQGNITEFPFTAPTYRLSSVLPALVIPLPSSPSGNQRYITPADGNQYSQTWSLSIQRALSASTMLETAYVGTSGDRLLMATNINAAEPGTTNPSTRQPFGAALGEVRELTNGAHSIYHGLQTKLEKRFSNGLYFLGSYTWSKSIDNQSNGTDNVSGSGQYPQDPSNWSLDRGPSSFDRTHRFVASAVWELPIARHLDPTSRLGAFALAVSKNWQLSGIFTAETGAPFSVLMSCADVNAGGTNCRPNVIANPNLSSSSINEWFNTAAFAIPSPQAWGDAGRNILRGPGMVDLDAGLSRSFPLGGVENRRIQVRSEFFNALNHTNFNLPVNSIDSPALGTITSSLPARIVQLGVRLEF